MAPALTVSPQPVLPSNVLNIAGTGFNNFKTRLALDGAGTSTNIFRPQKDGSFCVGITVSSTPKTQTLVAQQNTSGTTWVEVARVSVVVQAAPPPPPPPPPPPTDVPKGSFLAEYYSNATLSGTPVTVNVASVNFDWGSGKPGQVSAADNFSDRYRGIFTFEAADYDFTVTSNDGVRFYVDGVVQIDQWKDQLATFTKRLSLTAGDHELKIEHYEGGGTAKIIFAWAKVGVTPPPPPPPTPTLSVTQTVGTALSGLVAWTAAPSGTDPVTKVDFYVDGVVVNTDTTSPYAYALDTTTLSDGTHALYVVATGATLTATSTTVSATVDNTTTPPPPTGQPAFGTRPASGQIILSGVTGRTISNLYFKNTPSGSMAIVLNNCHDITIDNCDFENVPGCVYAAPGSSNITITNNRAKNITGPSVRTGANVGNFTQFNGVTGGLVAKNKILNGDTEDVISVYQSHNVIVEDNQIENQTWTSSSGSGIALGDSGGSGNIARRNQLLNPGQVGIFIAGGTNCKIMDNIIIGQQRAKSNVGMYTANYGGGTCSGHTVSGNQVSWKNASGGNNPYYDAGNCGTVVQTPANNLNANLDPNQYHVTL